MTRFKPEKHRAKPSKRGPAASNKAVRPPPAPPVAPGSRYRLLFVPPALAEWQALDGSVKEPLRALLRKRLDNPHVPGGRLYGPLSHCYKIKLNRQGYRLVYAVEDDALIVLVLSIDKREESAAYKSAVKRLLAKLAAVEPPR